MSKLSKTDFGQLITLAVKMDAQQKKDLELLLKMEPDQQQMFLRIFGQTVVTTKVEKNDSNPGVLATGKNVPSAQKTPTGRKVRPLNIITPKGIKVDQQIAFTWNSFGQYLHKQGLKSYKTYVYGMTTIMRDHGYNNEKISVIRLTKMRDSYTSNSSLDGTKRGYIKKMNNFFIHLVEVRKATPVA